MLKLNKVYLLIAWVISCFLFFEVAAHASEQDEATKLTFNQPVEIPGATLPAGTYQFKLLNPEAPYTVHIFSADGTRVLGSVVGIPTSRPEATRETVITFTKPADGTPLAIRKWFYPGRRTGIEFIYPKHEQQQLARDQVVNVTSSAKSGD
jgi:Protein of unknown function (DUF2911)